MPKRGASEQSFNQIYAAITAVVKLELFRAGCVIIVGIHDVILICHHFISLLILHYKLYLIIYVYYSIDYIINRD